MMDSTDCSDRIVGEATELFMTYGTKAVTMDMLAQNLGISKRTIYEKFRDKDELLLTVIKCMMQKQKKQMNDLIESEPNVLVAFFKHGQRMKEQFSSVNPILKSDIKRFHNDIIHRINDTCGDRFQNTLNLIVKGKEQGVFRSELNADIINRCFQGLSRIVADPEIFPPDQYSEKEIHRNVFMSFLRGIVTEEGAKVMEEYGHGFSQQR